MARSDRKLYSGAVNQSPVLGRAACTGAVAIRTKCDFYERNCTKWYQHKNSIFINKFPRSGHMNQSNDPSELLSPGFDLASLRLHPCPLTTSPSPKSTPQPKFTLHSALIDLRKMATRLTGQSTPQRTVRSPVRRAEISAEKRRFLANNATLARSFSPNWFLCLSSTRIAS